MGIFVVFTYGDRHYKLLTIKHIKWRQGLNEDVFEASALYMLFHRLLQKMLRWVPFGVFSSLFVEV